MLGVASRILYHWQTLKNEQRVVSMAWISLFIAGVFEVVWAVGLKHTHGFTRLWPTVFTVAGMMISFFFLSYSLKQLPMGTAYAVWTGIGAVGTVIYGIYFFHEPTGILRITCLALIILAIIGLKFSAH